MSTGVNTEKMKASRKELLDCIERLNVIFNDIDVQYASIQDSVEGTVKDIITKKYNEISASYEVIKNNVMVYVEDLGKVNSGFEEIDQELSEVVISDIDKVVERS